MATMKTLNGYGFNATELNGKAASDYLQKTDTATNSAKLGGKAPEYYIQPRNLLDNSDFIHPVNQRAITSETSVSEYSYFIDRWVNQTSEARSFTLSTSGIGLPLATTLLQKIEKIEAGKIVTFAIKLSDGTIATLTGTVQYTSDGSWTRFASIPHSFGDMYMETMNGFVNVVVYNTKVITIEWAALYEGSYTADTLPPYVPKGYVAELAECQRYAYLIPPYMAFSGYITSSSKNFVFPVWCPPMCNAGVKPTVASIPRMTIRTVNGYSSIASQDSPRAPSSLTVQDYHPDSYQMDLCATFSSDIGTNNTPAAAQFRFGDSALISLDL